MCANVGHYSIIDRAIEILQESIVAHNWPNYPSAFDYSASRRTQLSFDFDFIFYPNEKRKGNGKLKTRSAHRLYTQRNDTI